MFYFTCWTLVPSVGCLEACGLAPMSGRVALGILGALVSHSGVVRARCDCTILLGSLGLACSGSGLAGCLLVLSAVGRRRVRVLWAGCVFGDLRPIRQAARGALEPPGMAAPACWSCPSLLHVFSRVTTFVRCLGFSVLSCSHSVPLSQVMVLASSLLMTSTSLPFFFFFFFCFNLFVSGFALSLHCCVGFP